MEEILLILLTITVFIGSLFLMKFIFFGGTKTSVRTMSCWIRFCVLIFAVFLALFVFFF